MDKKKWGDYELLGTLGKGSQGVVYKARQPLLDRLVAIKVLPSSVAADESFIARFTREAQNIARLSHPNIVHVYDMNILEGTYFYVMEFIEGEDLGKVLKQGREISWEQVVDITTQVAAALEAAAEQNMVHRDIKPENIMITSKGQVKVADFGLAKVTTGGSNVTREGMILGTVNYMAPEQAKGLECDIRSDLYSLGVVLFRMLTGDLPFKGENLHSIIYKHINEPPPNPRDVNPNCPPVLSRICLKLLDKRPERRYQTPRELIRALETVHAPATPTSVVDRSDMQTVIDLDGSSVGSSSPTASIQHPITVSRGPRRKLVSPAIGIPFMLIALVFGGYLADRMMLEGKYSGKLFQMVGFSSPTTEPVPSPSLSPSPDVATTPPPRTPPQVSAPLMVQVSPEISQVEVKAEDGTLLPVPPAEGGKVSMKLKPGRYSIRVFSDDCKDREFSVEVSPTGEIEPRSEFVVELEFTDEKKAELDLSLDFRAITKPEEMIGFFAKAVAQAIKYPDNKVISGFRDNAQKDLQRSAAEHLEKAQKLLVAISARLTGDQYVDLKGLDLSPVRLALETSEKFDKHAGEKFREVLEKLEVAFSDFVKAEEAENTAINDNSPRKGELLAGARNLYRRFVTSWSDFAPVQGLVEKSQKRIENIESRLSDRENFLAWLVEVEKAVVEIRAVIDAGKFPEAQEMLKAARKLFVDEKPKVRVVDPELEARVLDAEKAILDTLPPVVERGLRNREEVVWKAVDRLAEAMKAKDLAAVSALFAPGVARDAYIAELKEFFGTDMVSSVSIQRDPTRESVVENDSANLSLVWELQVQIISADGNSQTVTEKVPIIVLLRYEGEQWLIAEIAVPAGQ